MKKKKQNEKRKYNKKAEEIAHILIGFVGACMHNAHARHFSLFSLFLIGDNCVNVANLKLIHINTHARTSSIEVFLVQFKHPFNISSYPCVLFVSAFQWLRAQKAQGKYTRLCVREAINILCFFSRFESRVLINSF